VQRHRQPNRERSRMAEQNLGKGNRKVARQGSTVKTGCLLIGKIYTVFLAYGSPRGAHETFLASLQRSR
jgi:hypothetical protein